MNRDICLGLVIFFVIKSILGIIELIGYLVSSYLIHSIYITPILLLVTVIILLIGCFCSKKKPVISLWIIPIIVLTNFVIAYTNYPEKLVSNFSEIDRTKLFIYVKGIEQISLFIFVVLAYIKYYRLSRK